MFKRSMFQSSRTALRRSSFPFVSPTARRWNHGQINFQKREPEYGFYDLSTQQPVGSNPSFNPITTAAAEAESRLNQADVARQSGQTTGVGSPPTQAIGNIIFGSRLAGPAPRPPPAPETIRVVEGIEIPPRPEEPDNCCMSGCVHCVWDIYREDIEHWQSSRQRARDALKAKKKRIPAWLGGKVAQKEELDPLAEIDPGLRAFMELEKRLKEKRVAREAAL